MNKKQEIIEETINVVARKGLEGFTAREIAKSLGISHTNIYAYYKTKEELLLDCFYQVNEEIAGVFENLNIVGEASVHDLETILHDYWIEYFNFMISNGNHSLFYYAFRESSALSTVYMRNNAIVAGEMAHFMSEFTKLLKGLKLASSNDLDYLWVYLLDGTGAFVKHIIKGHTTYNKDDAEKVWKFMYGGLSGMASLGGVSYEK